MLLVIIFCSHTVFITVAAAVSSLQKDGFQLDGASRVPAVGTHPAFSYALVVLLQLKFCIVLVREADCVANGLAVNSTPHEGRFVVFSAAGSPRPDAKQPSSAAADPVPVPPRIEPGDVILSETSYASVLNPRYCNLPLRLELDQVAGKQGENCVEAEEICGKVGKKLWGIRGGEVGEICW